MNSWFKVAEDLLEVVDRRAKLVVGELSDEQSDSQPSASNGGESQARRTKSREKAQKKLSSNEPIKTKDIAREQISTLELVSNRSNDNNKVELSSENIGPVSTSSTTQTSKELQSNFNKDTASSDISLPETPLNDGGSKDEANYMTEVPSTVNDTEPVISSMSGELAVEKTSEEHEDSSLALSTASVFEAVDMDLPADNDQNIRLTDEDTAVNIDQEKTELETAETHSNNDTQKKDADIKDQPFSEPKMQREHKSDNYPIIVQDQLDEAQGLLKSAISSGQSKEARLARVCAGLSSRLQEYKSENAQLEELLIAERERSNSYEAQIRQLQQDLSISKMEVTRVESNILEALAGKNSEIEALVSSMAAFKKQATVSEGKLASLQADLEYITRNRELTETRMMQALREEIASAERRAEDERAAHNATKKAAMEREVELEHRAAEASTALARIQRAVDERTARAAELEQKLALLEVECASLNQELQDMESRAKREQKRSPEEANQTLQAWQEEVEHARQGQRDAESRLFSLEAEVQKMRVEMAAMKRDAEHYSRQEHMELEKRYRELTDLLYYKQTQLETMASEKAAAEFHMEKEIKRLQEAQVEVERSRVSRRASSSWVEETDLKVLEPLPLHHRHMVGASIQFQKAAKLLDSGAVRATKFLWRYPVARVILLFYLVFVHLFLMYLLHRLQEQADSFNPREVAESMGLANPTLP
ncbi:golgin candidate 1-like isoform X2 [Macadamia integrifolia]|uniref:golgin candidate 1-like isoform X2 n=1 Tax=Macadamia integrifolia TaxID=60698 RepID=UPI001C4F2689|nr:golgin candidate 1-like isoform X2 [Macadamia integrifolia]